MTPSERAALTAAVRAQTIAECRRALNAAADSVVHNYRARAVPWLPQGLIDGYRNSAQFLGALVLAREPPVDVPEVSPEPDRDDGGESS